jgi:glycosyltransferase involved in cell wall biosynthesis
VAGWAVAALRRRPFVFEVADLWPASIVAVGAMRRNFILRRMERLELFLYRRASRVVALTSAFRQDMVERGIPGNKISVVTNGVDLPRYRRCHPNRELARSLGLAPEHFVVGYIGTLGMAHALENLLETAKLLRETSVRFLLVGPGAARARLIEIAREASLRNVIFVPPAPKEATPDYWSLCDLALVHLKNSPVFETVLPSKVFEAMAMGLPVVLSSPAGEASRLVLEAKAGVWTPPENPPALANAILRLQKDHELRQGLAASAAAAAPHHSREFQARAVLQVMVQAARARDAAEPALLPMAAPKDELAGSLVAFPVLETAPPRLQSAGGPQ